MIVLTLVNCPPALRGDLTAWLQEISAGVFVGHVSARVREALWERVTANAKDARACMVYSSSSEQRMDFRVHNADWVPIDFDGLKLVLRPSSPSLKKRAVLRAGFSRAARMHKARAMMRQREKKRRAPHRYLVFDIETTGLSVQNDHIIEISALRIEDGTVTDEFSALVQCPVSLPPAIASLTGISEEKLRLEGKPLETVLKAFLLFADELPVVAHNAAFDLSFLQAACSRCGLERFSNPCTDTYALARRLLDEVENYKLSTLAAYFDIKIEEAHRSRSDCLATQRLYEKLIEIAAEEK